MACGLDLFGDRWTLLVVRDLLHGKVRFKEFAAPPERIPINLLSDRLARLLRHDAVVQVTPADGSKHLAYRLTEKGEALRPVLRAMRDWGLSWEPGKHDNLGVEGGGDGGKAVGAEHRGPVRGAEGAGSQAPALPSRPAPAQAARLPRTSPSGGVLPEDASANTRLPTGKLPSTAGGVQVVPTVNGSHPKDKGSGVSANSTPVA